MMSKTDKIPYFSPAACDNVSCTDENDPYRTWVGRFYNTLYIVPNERALKDSASWFAKPENDCWLQRPAMLAYHRAYPLDKKDGDLFSVPVNWKECAKHPLVERNLLLLTDAVRTMNSLKERHGVYSAMDQWDSTNVKLKAALEPLAHLGIYESLGIK